MKIAILGTRGVPPRYGGFETCADEVSRGLASRGHAVTVYCRHGNAPGDPPAHGAVSLRYTRHIDRKALGTLTHTFTATLDAVRRDYDVLLYFNAANALPALMARLRGRPVVLNVDGLEWRRGKWGRVAKTYYHCAEWLSTKVADRLIADSRAIQDYYERRWKAPSTFIPYGADVEGPRNPALLKDFGVEPGGYFLTVSRLEPENNADLSLRAFAQVATEKSFLMVGGGTYGSRFAARLQATGDRRVVFTGPVYDSDRLRELYCGAFAYVHGNEVGGTNPALLRAMGHSRAVLALDVPFNRETVGGTALLYRKDPADLAAKMRELLARPDLAPRLGADAAERVRSAYRWDDVVDGYERLLGLVTRGAYLGRPPSDGPVPKAREAATHASGA